MTAVTLSRAGFRTSIRGEEAVEVIGRGTIVGVRQFPVVVDTPVGVAVAGTAALGDRAGAGAGAGAGARGSHRGGEDLEHEARGLLNLVVLVSRCLRDEAATPDERRRWLDELRNANERLEALYRSGLSREFLSKAPATSVFTR